ncbi:hypothetical protein ABL78_4403 [Leptomonas seymouri]|uniref:Uncharacterized protein n=1 Tax=Leptomonas seymouri TaxID=5684 RepID=A0A0N1HWN5_LEPSE|nr:hypothetical protein ABL78_4403 [Leptomonas seymouri]|eukprot:KPI86538.1 hypothetical protein ABL78_4403 [Leptomonas seymouri]
MHADATEPCKASSAKAPMRCPHALAPHPYNIDGSELLPAPKATTGAHVRGTRDPLEEVRSLRTQRRRYSSNRHPHRRASPPLGKGDGKDNSGSARAHQTYRSETRSDRHHVRRSSTEIQLGLGHQPRRSSPIISAELPRTRHRDPHVPELLSEEDQTSSYLRSPPRRSRSTLKHLFRQLEAEAAQLLCLPKHGSKPAGMPGSVGGNDHSSSRESHREAHRSAKELYQELFLQALEDGAAWEHRARALEASVQAHSKREEHLARQLQRTQQKLALLAAYVEGAERVAAVVSPERSTVPALPPRRPVRTTTTAATSLMNDTRREFSIEHGGGAAAAGRAPLPRRQPSRSAVSDLIRGSLGRSLDLAYGGGGSSSSSSGVAERGYDQENPQLEGADTCFSCLTHSTEFAAGGHHRQWSDEERGFEAADESAEEAGEARQPLLETDLDEVGEGDAEALESEEAFQSRFMEFSRTAQAVLQTPSPMLPHSTRGRQHGARQQLLPCDPASPPSMDCLASSSPSLTRGTAGCVGSSPSSAASAAEIQPLAHTTTAAAPLGVEALKASAAGVKIWAAATPAIPASPFIAPQSDDSPSNDTLSKHETESPAVEASDVPVPQHPSSTSASSQARKPTLTFSVASAAKDLLTLMRSRDSTLSYEPRPSPKATQDISLLAVSAAAGVGGVQSTVGLQTSSSLTQAEEGRLRQQHPSQLPIAPPLRPTPSPTASHSHSVDYEVTVNDGHRQRTTRPSASSVESAAASSKSPSTPMLIAPAPSSIAPRALEQKESHSISAPIAAMDLLRHLSSNASPPFVLTPSRLSGQGKETMLREGGEGVGGDRAANIGVRAAIEGAHSQQSMDSTARQLRAVSTSQSEEWESVDTSSSTRQSS